MGKRKQLSDEIVADDSDDGGPPAQRAKTGTASSHFASAAQKDDNGEQYWEISKTRRVTISEFQKKKMVNVREYYEKEGKALPGRKGISMTLEQYSTFVQLLPQIETALQRDGFSVPRPNYDKDETLVDDGEAGDMNGQDNEGGIAKKSNIDATSDEDEGE